jgi:hypothetical protein
MDDVPARVAVLEQIARNTEATLTEIRADVREIRGQQDRDFRWLLGLYLAGTAAILGVMAHGFRWL